MTERFAKSPIKLRRAENRSVSIEFGGERFAAGQDEPGGERVPVPPPKKPPWRAMLVDRGQVLSEVPIEEGATEELEHALRGHGEVELIRVDVPASSLTRQEIEPLVALSRQSGVDIDIHLGVDG